MGRAMNLLPRRPARDIVTRRGRVGTLTVAGLLLLLVTALFLALQSGTGKGESLDQRSAGVAAAPVNSGGAWPPEGAGADVAEETGTSPAKGSVRAPAAGVGGGEQSAEAYSWRGLVIEKITGRGLSGARVELTFEFEEAKDVTAVTDERGVFDLTWVVPGTAFEQDGAGTDAEQPQGRLEISAADFVSLRRYPFCPPRETLAVAAGDGPSASESTASIAAQPPFALERAGWIRGQVAGWGMGEAGEICLRHWHRELALGEERGAVARTSLDSAGRFAFTALVPGQYSLAVQDRGLIFEPGITVRAGEETWVELGAPATGSLRGQVLLRGRTRSGVAEAEVEVWPTISGAGSAVEQDGLQKVETDGEGRFVFEGLRAGGHDLRVRTSWDDIALGNVTVEQGAEAEITLRVSPSAELVVRVIDGEGAPLEEVEVVLIAADFLEHGDRGLWGIVATPQEETDDDGRCAFTRLRAGIAYTPFLELYDEDWQGSWLEYETLKLKSGAQQEELVLVYDGDLTIVGRVLESEEATAGGVAGARVNLAYGHGMHFDHPEAPIYKKTVTGADGSFRFEDVPRKACRVSVEAVGFVSERLACTPRPDADILEVTLHLAPSWDIEGVVVDGDGNTLDGGRVLLNGSLARMGSKRQSNKAPRPGQDRPQSTAIDSWGRFQFTGLSSDSVGLLAAVPFYRQEPAGQSVVVFRSSPSPFVTLVLEPVPMAERAALRGRIEMADGSPVEDLAVRGKRGGTLTQEGDSFTLRGMEPGRASLTFMGRGAVPLRTQALELAPGSEMDLGLVELRLGTDLKVRLVDENGRRIKRGGCVARPLGKQGRDKPPAGDGREVLRRDITNGELELPGLGRGRWLLEIKARDYKAQEVFLRLKKGQQMRVVTMEPKG
jgi:hypothetical protein